MKNPFTEHPHSVGETYFEHMKKALKYSFVLYYAFIVVMIHALYPFLFTTTGSDVIAKLHKELKGRKNER